MKLPSFAPFPPANLRKDIVPEEWALCLDAWLFLAEGHLLLSHEAFAAKVSKDPSVAEFLNTYINSETLQVHDTNPGPNARSLRRACYLLIHRCLSEMQKKPPWLLNWHFLADLSIAYANRSSLKPLLQGLWDIEEVQDRSQKHKVSLISTLEGAGNKDDHSDMDTTLARVAALLRACPKYGEFLMRGSDFMDAMSTFYGLTVPFLKRKLVVIMYRCFLALIDSLNPRYSMLLDHLYGLDSSADPHSLLSAVCSSTPFVRKLRDRVTGPDAVRAEKLIQQLSKFEGTGTLPLRPKKPARKRADKGKGKEIDDYGHGAIDQGLHIHKMSLVTQIQDLFPDLGSAFVVKLLDEYGDDMEQVTAHLLDDSLPSHLKTLDRSENIPQPPSQPATDLAPHLAPRTSPSFPPTRRNIYDNDAFDRLAISPSQIHRGLKDSSKTADTVLQDRSSAPNKAAILSALTAFDSDDDERDDTYDIEDVGGTVDAALPGSDEVDADLRDKNEEALSRAWNLSPEVFERDA
ncbi:MAG: hypothetical protein Q9179_003732, partial [Wetmoreana sp. 5 TL-2023]